MAMNVGEDRKQRTQKSVSDINVAPLVDVLLVLLIIFMVTSPIVYQSIKVPTPENAPNDTKSDPKEVEKATLTITKTGSIILKKQTVSEDKLLNFIKKDPELQKKKELYIKANVDLYYGTVMKIMAIVRKSGINKIGMIVEDTDLIPEQPTPAK